MSKIRWRKSDLNLLRKAVQKYNAKITRVSKKYPELAGYQPNRLNVQELEAVLRQLPRSEFNKQIAAINRYMKKGAEQVVENKAGAKMTKYQKREVQIQRANINRKRTRLREEKGISTTAGTMGRIEDYALRPLPPKDYNKLKQEEWEKFVKQTERKYMDELRGGKTARYYENLQKSAVEVFGKNSLLVQFIKELEPEEAIDYYFSSRYFSFDWIYDDFQDLETRQRVLYEEMERLNPQAFDRALNKYDKLPFVL